MKCSKFSDSQIMDSLKRVDAGLAVPEVYCEPIISTFAFYKWRAKFGVMNADLIFSAHQKERII